MHFDFPTIAEEREISLGQFLHDVAVAETQIKLDGERLACLHSGDDTTFVNRHGTSWSGTELPRLASGVKQIFGDRQAVVDGELVAAEGFYGKNGFLENRDSRDRLTYVLFDLLELDGQDLRGKPFIERWHILQEIMKNQANETINIVPSQTVASPVEAKRIFDYVTDTLKLEGVVVKPHGSIYTNGAWLKIKKVWTDDLRLAGIRKTDGFKQTGIASAWLVETLTGERRGSVGSGLSWSEREALTNQLLLSKVSEDREYIYCNPPEPVIVEVVHNGEIKNDKTKQTALRSPRIVRLRPDR